MTTIASPDLYVDSLPPRVAHVTHALILTAALLHGSATAVATYIKDWEADSVYETTNALSLARHEGLVAPSPAAPGRWVATEKAQSVAAALARRSRDDEEASRG